MSLSEKKAYKMIFTLYVIERIREILKVVGAKDFYKKPTVRVMIREKLKITAGGDIYKEPMVRVIGVSW